MSCSPNENRKDFGESDKYHKFGPKGEDIDLSDTIFVDDDFELRYSANNVFRVDRLFPLVKYKEIRKELIKRGEIEGTKLSAGMQRRVKKAKSRKKPS